MKTKCLMYCTKGNYKNHLHKLYRENKYPYYQVDNVKDWKLEPMPLNGKIVAECDCDKVEEIVYNGWWNCYANNDSIEGDYFDNDFACLSVEEMKKYLGDKNGYALHISNLKIFDNPLELKDTYTRECTLNKCSRCEYGKEGKINCGTIDIPLSRAPQNMMWVWYKGERYVLISIQSKWLCKILNGEKTIEVRRKVLNCMKEVEENDKR